MFSKKINQEELGATATAAKLFYEMLIGKPGKPISVVMLEVRYKGALTGEPQFQVFMSVKKNSFANLYKKEAAKKTFKFERVEVKTLKGKV